MTIGIVRVDSLAARTAGVLEETMMSTLSWIRSAMISGNCSVRPPPDPLQHDDVLALDPTQLAQALAQVVRVVHATDHDPDPGDLAGLLRLGGERR
jgi:hypothetical protein